MSKLTLKEIQNRLDILDERWHTFDYEIKDPELLSALEFAVDGLAAVKHIAEKMVIFNNGAPNTTYREYYDEVRDIIYDLTCTGPDYEE